MSLFDDPALIDKVVNQRRAKRLKGFKPAAGQAGLFAAEARDAWSAPGGWAAPELRPIPAGVTDVDFDTESRGLKPWLGAELIGVSCSYEPRRGSYYPFGHMGGGNLPREQVFEWMRRELPGKRLHMIRAKHDVQLLRAEGVDLDAMGCRVFDVAHMAALLNEKRKRYNLDDLAFEVLKERKSALDLGAVSGHKSAMAEKSAAEVGPYAERDAWLLRGLRDAYLPRLQAQGLMDVFDLESRVIMPVVEMEGNGSPIDVPLLERWIKETQLAYEHHMGELRKIVGLPINPDAGADMHKAFVLLKLPFTYTVDEETGAPTDTPSFADAVLRGIEVGAYPDDARRAIGHARKAKAIRSLRSKYLLKYQKHLGASDVLRYELHQLGADDYGTVTGRFSSSDVNIQQVFKPSKQARKVGVGEWIIRALFVPAPGKRWLAADARQIELRLAAHYAALLGMRRLADIYAKDPDVDFHNVVTEFVGLPRDITKNYSFMKLFGGGVDRGMEMSAESGFPKTRAQVESELARYDELFPEFKTIMDKTSAVAEKRGYVRTVKGRRRRYADEKDPRYYSALNAIIQGTAGDVNKVKMVELYEARKLLGIDLRLTNHDENDMDVDPDPRKAEMVRELLDAQSIPFEVPIKWEVKTGASWALA